MNFYKNHIGDYLRDTSHLSLLEHGVYKRLLDVYYTREAPLPSEDQSARLIGARSKDEREALSVVLGEFFQRDGDMFRHKRCDAEIGAYLAKAKKNQEVGAKGGRPKKADNSAPNETTMVPHGNPNETMMVSDENPNGFEKKPKPVASNQKPVASNQKPDSTSQITGLTASNAHAGASPGAASQAMRKHGITSNPQDPRLIALCAKADLGAIEAACEEARRKKPDERITFGYVLAILDRWIADAEKIGRGGQIMAPPKVERLTPAQARAKRNEEILDEIDRECRSEIAGNGADSHDAGAVWDAASGLVLRDG